MGCDIHLHIEIKVADKWEHYSCPSIDRWYRLFGKMAGVRTDEEDYISIPKGLPEDMSVVTKMSYKSWEGDAHSMSWLSSKELLELSKWLDNIPTEECRTSFNTVFKTYLFGNYFIEFLEEEDEDNMFPQELQDFRFIFWFDN